MSKAATPGPREKHDTMPHIIRGDVFRFIVDGCFGHQKSPHAHELRSEDATATNAKLVISLSTAPIVRGAAYQCRGKIAAQKMLGAKEITRGDAFCEREGERERTEGVGYLDSI